MTEDWLAVGNTQSSDLTPLHTEEGEKVNMAVEEGVVFLAQVSSGFILTFVTGLFNSEKLEMCCDLILF